MATSKKQHWTTLLCFLVLLVSPAVAEIEGDFPEVVLFATSSMEIESNAEVFSGDVVVNQASAGTLVFGNKAKTPAGWEVKANTIDVGNNVNLAGTESCNFGDFSPCDFSLATPVYGALPLFADSTPGGTNVNVPNSGSATVTGDALDITIGLEGTVTFTPGVHNVRSITASKKADLVFSGPTEIRVEQGVSMGVEANINLSGAADASTVIFYVGGDATLGSKSTVNANVYLETGTLVIPGNVIATGAFLAENLIVESKAKIHLETFFDAPPVANDDAYSTDEDVQLMDNTAGPLGIGVLANDTDADNDLLEAVLLTDVSNGSLTLLSDGSFTYDPDPDYYGPDSFTYWACDELPHNVDNCDSATVDITVEPVNDKPSFDKGPDQAVDEDAEPQTVPGWATNISPGPTNESGQTVSFNVVSDNPGLLSQLAVDSTGTLTYTPAADEFGTANISIEAMDDGGTANGGEDTSDAQSFTITVNSVNDAPVAGDDAASTDEDTPVTIAIASLLTNDTAGPVNEDPALTLDSVASSGNNHVKIVGTDVEYTPNADFFGTDTFNYVVCDGGQDNDTVTDGDDLCDTGTVTVSVAPVNDAPTADSQDVNTDGGADLSIVLTASDPDADTLTFTLSGPAPAGTLSPASAFGFDTASVVVTYTPATANNLADGFSFQVADGNGGTDIAIVRINPSGDPACTVGSCDAGFVCNVAEGICEPEEVSGVDAKDQINQTDPQVIPDAGPVETNTGEAVEIILFASAESGIDDLIFTIDSGPTSGSFLTPVIPIDPVTSPIRSAKITYEPTCTPSVPAGEPVCTASFMFKACEAALPTNCDTATVEINVTPDDEPADEPPVAEDMSVSTVTAVPMTFSLLGSPGEASDRECLEDSECGPGFFCNGQGICEPELFVAPPAGESFAGGDNGAPAATSAAAATRAPIVPDSGWTASPNFGWSGSPIATPPCVPVGGLCPLAAPVFSPDTFEFTGDTCVTIVDDFYRGDRFAIYDNGQLVGATPVVAVATVPDSGVGPDAALADPTRSSGTFALGPGSHSITIEVLLPSFQSGGDFLRVDSSTSSYCDPSVGEGGTPLLTYTVLTVPNPTTFGTLTDSSGAPVTAGSVLTNPELTFTPVATTGSSSFTYEVTNTETGLTSLEAAIVDVAIFPDIFTDPCTLVGRPSGCTPGVAPTGDPQAASQGSESRRGNIDVELLGDGSGVVTADRMMDELERSEFGRDAAVCAGTCRQWFEPGSAVKLQARPIGEGSVFLRWGGDCAGAGDDPIVEVQAPAFGQLRTCTATFGKQSP